MRKLQLTLRLCLRAGRRRRLRPCVARSLAHLFQHRWWELLLREPAAEGGVKFHHPNAAGCLVHWRALTQLLPSLEVGGSASTNAGMGGEDAGSAPPGRSPEPPNSSTILHGINSRFADGHPSNRLDRAGLLVHVFDYPDCWLPAQLPWALRNDTTACSERDHLSASFMSAKAPFRYQRRNHTVGMIIAPASASVLCSYVADGDSDLVPAGGCRRPRCSGNQSSWYRTCPFPPDQLREMLLMAAQRHESLERNPPSTKRFFTGVGGSLLNYNEVILARAPWVRRLPSNVEAIVFFGRDIDLGGWHGVGDVRDAQQVHAAFLERYGASVGHVPLVQMQAGHFVDITAGRRRKHM